MNDKKDWVDEPVLLCAPYYGHWATICTDAGTIFDIASDLERRLRHAAKIVGRLRADSDCGDFNAEDLEQRLKQLDEVLTP